MAMGVTFQGGGHLTSILPAAGEGVGFDAPAVGVC